MTTALAVVLLHPRTVRLSSRRAWICLVWDDRPRELAKLFQPLLAMVQEELLEVVAGNGPRGERQAVGRGRRRSLRRTTEGERRGWKRIRFDSEDEGWKKEGSRVEVWVGIPEREDSSCLRRGQRPGRAEREGGGEGEGRSALFCRRLKRVYATDWLLSWLDSRPVPDLVLND